jgi:hypothetical protein
VVLEVIASEVVALIEEDTSFTIETSRWVNGQAALKIALGSDDFSRYYGHFHSSWRPAGRGRLKWES